MRIPLGQYGRRNAGVPLSEPRNLDRSAGPLLPAVRYGRFGNKHGIHQTPLSSQTKPPRLSLEAFPRAVSDQGYTTRTHLRTGGVADAANSP